MKTLRNLLLFLMGLVLTCAGLGKLLPPFQVPIVTPKLNWALSHGDEYDVLFIGSSRTFRQLIPELFEEELAKGGHQVRALNLGVDGMRPPEDTYLLEKALAGRTKPLKFVVVECNPIRLSERDEDRDTLRAVYWHDWARTMSLFRRAFLSDPKKRNWSSRFEKIAEAWPDFSSHGYYWVWNNSNLGRGHEFLADWLRPTPKKPLSNSDLGKRQDGYRPASDMENMTASQRAKYEKLLGEEKARNPKLDHGDRASLDELHTKQRLIQQAGARMFLITPPFIADRHFVPKDKDLPPVQSYYDAAKYPDLFQSDHRSDEGHTNTEGSVLYTRLVARDILEQLNAPAPTP